MNFDEKLSEKIDKYLARFEEINNLLTLEEVLCDEKMSIRLEKERKLLLPIAEKLEEINCLKNEINNKKANSQDLNEDFLFINQKIKNLETDLIEYIANMNSSNQQIIIELNAVKLTSKKLFNFLFDGYKKFCENNNLSFNILQNDGAFVKTRVEGQNAYDLFKNENGIHKSLNNSVQVVVYNDFEIKKENFGDKDIKIEIFRSNGAGGQNVNKVSTAVRITHLQTGITVSCQDERSQIQNKQRALENLKAKVEKVNAENCQKTLEIERKKNYNKTIIRNYNFEKDIITDLKTKMEFEMSKNTFELILNLKKIGS
ncbi:MAG TPA: hypothetical protein DCO89_03540 [Clostridiales bacterium]|nr:hypothetical protein [Clostridiales bacterium]